MGLEKKNATNIAESRGGIHLELSPEQASILCVQMDTQRDLGDPGASNHFTGNEHKKTEERERRVFELKDI